MRCVIGTLVCSLVICVASWRAADEIRWVNPTGGSFHESTNWVPQQVPGSDDSAIFDLVSTQIQVSFDANVLNSAAAFRSGDFLLDLRWFRYALTNETAPSLVVGSDSSVATLGIVDGIVEAHSTDLLAPQGLRSYLSIAGHKTQLRTIEDLHLASLGRFTLTAEDGAEVLIGRDLRSAPVQQTFGEINLSGTGTLLRVERDMRIGERQNNDLFVSKGASVAVEGDAYFAQPSRSRSVCILDDARMKILGVLRIGAGGTPRITVQNGSFLHAESDCDVGTADTGQNVVVIRDAGSLFRVDGRLRVGLEHNGPVHTGGVLVGANASLATHGRVEVDSDGDEYISLVTTSSGTNWFAKDDVDFGVSGRGEGAFYGGEIRILGHLRFGIETTGFGLMTASGSTIETPNPVIVGVLGRGYVSLGTNSVLRAPLVLISDRSRLDGRFGAVEGDLRLEGELRVGQDDRIEALTVDGDYDQSGTGTFQVSISNENDIVQNDKMDVTGTATFAGRLWVLRVDDFVPAAGERFVFVNAGLLQGAFDTLDYPDLPSDRIWMLAYEPTKLVLRVAAVPTEFSVSEGQLIQGNTSDLSYSDDISIEIESAPGSSIQKPKVVGTMFATSIGTIPEQIRIGIESRIDRPAGVVQVYVRNWVTDQFDRVGIDSVSTVDQSAIVHDLEGDVYARDGDGRVEVITRHSVLEQSNTDPFRAFIDQVHVESD